MKNGSVWVLALVLAATGCQNDEITEEMTGEEQSDYGGITGADTTAPPGAGNITGAPQRETPLTSGQPDTTVPRAPASGAGARDTTGS